MVLPALKMPNFTKIFKFLLPKTPSPENFSDECGLPPELKDMIVSYIHDINTLCALSLTCHSWHISTLPRLHHSLRTCVVAKHSNKWDRWSRPLEQLHKGHLLPLVKHLCISATKDFGFYPIPHDTGFGLPSNTLPSLSSHKNLRYFSALKNLQELTIEGIQLPSITSNVKQCFGHFAPTLQSLTLSHLSASCHQILYFIGLFPNLQDLMLYDCCHGWREKTIATLVPLSKPPLSRWLVLKSCHQDSLVDKMTSFYGGLNFRFVELFKSIFTEQVLPACAETLETFQLHEGDHTGEKLP